MSVKVKVNKEEKPKGEVVTFDNTKDYVAIKLKSDGKTYVEHKIFAKSLVDKKLAEYDKEAKLDVPKANTTILDNED